MNETEVNRFLKGFIRKHRATLDRVSYSQSQTLELALAVSTSQHYALSGYQVAPLNPKGNTFVVKTSTRGHPANVSRFVVSRGSSTFEIHMNLLVRSAHDKGIYCVDLGVVPEGLVPVKKTGPKWICLSNEKLISFAESKKLVIYPMLIAQFIGIVHEVTPRFLQRPHLGGFLHAGHFPPTLVCLGYFSGTSRAIVEGLRSRGIRLQVIPDFDTRLALLRRGDRESPFNDFRSRRPSRASPRLTPQPRVRAV